MRNLGARWLYRSLLSAIAYLLVAAYLTGCERRERKAGQGALPPAGSLVAIIGPSEFHPQWPGIRGGARRRAQQASHLRFEFHTPPENDPAGLTEMAQRILGRKPAALCVFVTDPELARPSLAEALRRGMVLVTVGAAVDDLTPYAHVAVAWPEAAEILGQNVAHVAAGRQSYVLLHENGRDRLATECYERFMNEARRQFSVFVLEERTVTGGELSPQTVIQQMLSRFPHAGLVVTLTAEPWLSLRPRLALDPPRRFATLGAVPALWPRLRDGEATALVGPLDGEIGYTMVDLALEGLTKEKPHGKVRVVRCELVTPDKLDDFSRRYAAAAGIALKELMP